MNDDTRSCRIDTGDWVGSRWNTSPEWTPYAQAIADYYPIQLPWFLTTTISIAAAPPALTLPRAVITRPQLYDVLIFGMSATQSPTPANSGMPYLNIFHEETGIPWVSPNTVGYAPLFAFAALEGAPLAVLKLPDAFFLPSHTELKIEWAPFQITPPVTINLTMIGVQLINHARGFESPRQIAMPNGDIIPVGSRIPWLASVPFGSRPNAVGRTYGSYTLPNLSQAMSYLPAQDCNFELHDIYAEFLDVPSQSLGSPSLLRTKLDDTRTREDWTPFAAPITAVFGSAIQANPTMPLTRPQLVKTDHKISMLAQNQSGSAVTNGTVTFRGVRLCKY